MFDALNFSDLFTPTVNPLEMVIRGSVVYLSLFAMLRLLMKRESSEVGVTNLLVIVLLADAAQNAMSAEYRSITDGLILVATIISWSYLLDWLSYKSRFFNRLIRPGKLLLAKDGKLLKANMGKELITEEEIMIEVRSSGYHDLSEVREIYMESNGAISVIGYERPAGGSNRHGPHKRS